MERKYTQPKAQRPSQLRLTDEDIQLPPRLVHIQNLPWLDCYDQQLRTENKSENTRKTYLNGLRALVETPLLGEEILSESDLESMNVVMLAKRLEPLNGRIDRWTHSMSELSPSTYNARLAAARHMIKWLGHRWPDHLVRRTGRKLPRTLTRRELTSVIEAANTSENAIASVVVTVLLDTGMRVSELCNLNLADMELEGLHAKVIGGKGDKDRIVLFTQRTKNCIDAYLPIRSSRLRDNEHPFLLNQAGRRLQPRGVQRLMDQLAIEAGLPKGNLHHTSCAIILQQGCSNVEQTWSPFSGFLATPALQRLACISISPTKPCVKCIIVLNRCVRQWMRSKCFRMRNSSNKKVEPKPSVSMFHERERFASQSIQALPRSMWRNIFASMSGDGTVLPRTTS